MIRITHKLIAILFWFPIAPWRSSPLGSGGAARRERETLEEENPRVAVNARLGANRLSRLYGFSGQDPPV